MVLRPTPIKLFVPESMQKRYHPYQFPSHGQHNPGNLLGNVLLGVNPLCRPTHGFKSTRMHIPKQIHHELPQSKAQNWKFPMPMQGFKGEHIKVTVQQGHVHVEARRNDGEDENSRNYGMSRTITLPQTVDATKLTSQLSDKGFLIIEAPFKTLNLITSPSARATKVHSGINTQKSSAENEKSTFLKSDKDELKNFSNEDIEIGEISKLVQNVNKDNFSETQNVEKDIKSETEARYDEEKQDSSETHHEQLTKSPDTVKTPAQERFYRTSLNLGKFLPENIQISLEGTSLVIKAEKKDESGFNCTFTRRYFLPGNLDLSALRCRRDVNGIMTIYAPYRK